VSPLIIPIALEWVILVTTAAPLILVGRFNKHPRLGMALWFSTLLSSGVAALLALSVAVWSIFDTYLKLSTATLGSDGWLATLGISFGPWLILAISGVSLALINQRVEPLVANARELEPLLDSAARYLMTFEDYRVSRIELPIMVAAVNRGSILISSKAVETLTGEELNAVLWHEVGHLRGRHNELKTLANFTRTLSQWLVASRALVLEVERLTELDADNFARKRVDSGILKTTRAKFISS
jgi:Zn-dependent protease with chaperone function